MSVPIGVNVLSDLSIANAGHTNQQNRATIQQGALSGTAATFVEFRGSNRVLLSIDMAQPVLVEIDRSAVQLHGESRKVEK